MIFIKIIYSLLFIAWGVALLKYRRTVKSWTGNFVWAEKYLGNWWTYLVIILFGLFFIFFGVLYPFGWFDLIIWSDPATPSVLPTE